MTFHQFDPYAELITLKQNQQKLIQAHNNLDQVLSGLTQQYNQMLNQNNMLRAELAAIRFELQQLKEFRNK